MKTVRENVSWIRHCFYPHYPMQGHDRILSWFGVAVKQTPRQRLEFKKFIWELILGNVGLRINCEPGWEASP